MVAVSTPALTLSQRTASIAAPDLLRLFDPINRDHFAGSLMARLHWEIPAAPVTPPPFDPDPPLPADPLLRHRLAQVGRLLEQGHGQAALPLLQACADTGHPAAKRLLIHLLKRLGNPRWRQLAHVHNQQFGPLNAVPASGHDAVRQHIILHPCLARPDTPEHVLDYLIHHECCHLWLGSHDDTHPPALLEREQQIPTRRRAAAWLRRAGFPVLEPTCRPSGKS